MRRRLACVHVLVVTLLLASGCATSPETKLALANDAFASTLNVLSDAREARLIDDQTQTQVIAPARRTVDRLLDEAYLAASRGESLKLVTILTEIDRELAPLLRQRFLLPRKESE